jgi:hypothetical protein
MLNIVGTANAKAFGMYQSNQSDLVFMLRHKPVDLNKLVVAAAIALALIAMAVCAWAGEPDAKSPPLAPPPLEPPPLSLIHGLINVEFSDHYMTPRGLDVQNKGLIVQPLVLLFFDLYSSKTNFLNDVTLTIGDWNSVHTATTNSGPKPGNWNETDPIVGLTAKFLQDFQFDIFYTNFVSQVDAYPTSSNLDMKLTYHDSFMEKFGIKGLSFNPYFETFIELNQKATVVLDSATSKKGYYFQLGFDPTYKFATIPLTIEFPTYINFPSDNFYQKFNGEGASSTIGLFTTEFKATVPLKFIPKGYGSWSIYAGVQYYYLHNEGLLDGNEVLATSERKRNIVQFHGGFTIFF